MKKWLTLAILLIVIGVVTTNGTFASDLNSIFQNVSQWIGEALGAPQRNEMIFQVDLISQVRENGSLRDGPQTQALIPGAHETMTQAQWIAAADMMTVLDNHPYALWDTAEIPGALDRFTSVRNLSQTTNGLENIEHPDPNDAYFRIAIALQKEAIGIIHLNLNREDFVWNVWDDGSEWKPIKIDGREYDMMIGTYPYKLPAGDTSPAALLQVAMDKSATAEQIGKLTADFLRIQVMAIDADGFVTDNKDGTKTQMSAKEALGYALPINSLNPF